MRASGVFQSSSSRAAALKGSAGLLAATMLITSVPTASASVSYEQARVVAVRPIYETVRYAAPREQCHEQRVQVPQYHAAAPGPSVTPTILGAVLGGALGNAVGHDSKNEKVGAAVGALLGGAIGYDVSRRRYVQAAQMAPSPYYHYRTEEVCRVVDEYREQERIVGYDVTYDYLGRSYTTRMDQDPGSNVRVRVQVTPLE